MQFKFQFPFNKWKESFRVQKTGNKNRLFSLLNFPARRHFQFFWRQAVAAIVKKELSFVWNNWATIWRHKIQNDGAREIL